MINKSDFLEMSYGTANSRLRKMIIFNLLVRHNENICFQCGEVIENIDDLSIEHKKPWLGRDKSLFWDLDNIAFSHLRCNTHAHKVSKGNSICSTCGKELPLESFSKNKSRLRGVESNCKECRSIYKLY